MSPASLPHPDSIIQSLFSHLSRLPLAPHGQPTTNVEQHDPTVAKPYLLTLHALFPTLLLPALDLLDRRLITRLELSSPPQPNDTDSDPAATSIHSTNVPLSTRRPPSTSAGDGESEAERQEAKIVATATAPSLETELSTTHPIPPLPRPTPPPTQRIYYVRSSQSVSTSYARFRHSHDYGQGAGNSYEVRTRAWSCSCAAFAFGAFSGSGSGAGVGAAGDGGYSEEEEEEQEEAEGGEGNRYGGEERARWGGLMALYHTTHGTGTKENEPLVPLCKHLLACVLAESWSEAGEMVEVRVVGNEELAGWAAGWGG